MHQFYTLNKAGMYGLFFAVLSMICLVECASVNCHGEACGRTPATPSPTTPSPVTTSSPEHHRLPCTLNETQSQGCLNGGTCFVLEIEGRKTICICTEEYAGRRCEYLDPNIIFQKEREQNIATAGIAASAVAATLFVTVLILIVVYHKRYKKRKQKEQQKANEEKLLHNGGTNANPYRDTVREPLTNITVNPQNGCDCDSTYKDEDILSSRRSLNYHNGGVVEGETRV